MKTATNYPKALTAKADFVQWLPIALIMSLAAGLYFYQLGTESLWIDELYSIADSQDPSLSSTRPLYFFLLHFWMNWGVGETWLRGLAVLFGLGSIFLTYCLGSRSVGKPVGLVAALLLTLSPLFINHAQEVRMYTLSTCLGLSGTLALTHVLERLNFLALSGWAIARILAILTTPLNAVLLLPDVVLFGWRFRHQRRFWLALGTGVLLIGILWLPAAFHIAVVSGPEYMSTIIRQPPGLTFIVSKLTNFTVFWPLKDLRELPSLVWFYQIVTATLVGLLAVAWLGRVRSSQWWIAAWAFLPPASLLLVSYLAPVSLWLPRYLLLTVPYLLILLAAGWIKIWQWRQKAAILLALLYFAAVGGGLTHYYSTPYREDWRGVMQTISAGDQPGDAVALAVANARPDQALTHYYRGTAPIEVLGEYSFSPENQPQFKERWAQRLETLDSRLWLVVYWGRRSIDLQEAEQLVKTPMLNVQSYEFSGPMYLFLVEPKSTSG